MITSFGMVLRKKADAELDMQYLSMFLNLPQTNSVLQAVSTGQSVAMAMLKRQTVADIEVAQASIDSLSEQIADILNTIEKKG